MADCSKLEDFLKERKRMCSSFDSLYQSWDQGLCDGCPLKKGYNCLFYNEVVNGESIQEAVNLVQQWSDEHPEPKPKTYADVFFELFPNAPTMPDGLPKPYVCDIYTNHPECYGCTQEDSRKCWTLPYPEQEEK